MMKIIAFSSLTFAFAAAADTTSLRRNGKRDLLLGLTRDVPGSACPCFNFGDLLTSFVGVPVDICSAPFDPATGTTPGGSIDNYYAVEEPHVQACSGSLCHGGDPHCVYYDEGRNVDIFMDNITPEEEAECILNIQSFCSGFETLRTSNPPGTPGPTGTSSTPGPSGSVFTFPPTGATGTPGPSTTISTPGPSSTSSTSSPRTDPPATPGPSTTISTAGPSSTSSTSSPRTDPPATPGPSTTISTAGPTGTLNTVGPSSSVSTPPPTGTSSTSNPRTGNPATTGPSGYISTAGPTGTVNTEGPSSSTYTPPPTGTSSTSSPRTDLPWTSTPSSFMHTSGPTFTASTSSPGTDFPAGTAGPSGFMNTQGPSGSIFTPPPSATFSNPGTSFTTSPLPDITREDFLSSTLGPEQLDLFEVLYLAFGAGNCQEVEAPEGVPDYIRGFTCEKDNRYKALAQTTGNVQLGLEIISLETNTTCYQSLCNRNPSIGFSFDECINMLEAFVESEYFTGATATHEPSFTTIPTTTSTGAPVDPRSFSTASPVPRATVGPSSSSSSSTTEAPFLPLTHEPSATVVPTESNSITNGPQGQLFTMTNAESGNQVLMFNRDVESGKLSFVDSYNTSGIGGAAQEGPNDPLASQDSLILTTNDECLVVVNAGSDSVTSFEVSDNGLTQAGVYNSGGSFPLSVTENAGLVYVLNAGGLGSISGFIKQDYGVHNSCALTPIAGSTRSLNITDGQNPPRFLVAPAQIGFTPDGSHLVVLIKGTNEGTILLYPVDYTTGLVGEEPISSTRSVGFTPFAFEFDSFGHLIVAEGFGTASRIPAVEGPTLNAGAVSSYKINSVTGELTPLTISEGTEQTATCWIRRHDTQDDSGCAYTTNNGNANSISSVRIDDRTGDITLIQPVAAMLDTPIDLSVVDDFLYVLSSGHRLDGQPRIHVYEITPTSCDIDLVEIVQDNIPHELVTVFGVVGMAAN